MTLSNHPLAATMINQLNRVDVLTNNLSNSNTVGFKEDGLAEGSFNSYLNKKEANHEDISKLSEIMNTIPKIDNNYIDSRLGSITPTGNNLDFAITQSDTYFRVKTGEGEKDIELTRDGGFKVATKGFLVDSHNHQILDKRDKPIKVDKNFDFIENISLVNVQWADLDKVGNNNYKITNEENLKQVDNSLKYLEQGSLEQSNTNSMKSMVALIDAQRRFAQAQKAITSIDEINKKVIDSIGNGR
jgi:flagellar basal-body rod protein FlgG